MEVCDKFQLMDINGKIRKFTWKIENFSSKHKMLCSKKFMVDGNKWQILMFPRGNNVDCLSIYLVFADSTILSSGWSRYAQFGFAVIDQIDRKTSFTKVDGHKFKAEEDAWGFTSFLHLSQLHNPQRGYLVNDTCLVEAYISSDRTIGLISRKLILKTDSDKHTRKEADCVEAAIDIPKATITKQVEITTPPSSEPSCPIVDIEPVEPKEPSEEDVNAFFTSLEAELSSSNIVFSREDVKEALSKLDEALSMTPTNLYDSGKLPLLKQAFKILASFDYSSTMLTIEKKNELLDLEESLRELTHRAAKAMQDKNCLTAKESMRDTITRNLDRNLIKYKEIKSEVKHVEQKLAALLAEQKKIFRSSKEMKMEMEALGKEWAECEVKAKVAEEEEKNVEVEWGRMKDFISFIKRKILKTL